MFGLVDVVAIALMAMAFGISAVCYIFHEFYLDLSRRYDQQRRINKAISQSYTDLINVMKEQEGLIKKLILERQTAKQEKKDGAETDIP